MNRPQVVSLALVLALPLAYAGCHGSSQVKENAASPASTAATSEPAPAAAATPEATPASGTQPAPAAASPGAEPTPKPRPTAPI